MALLVGEAENNTGLAGALYTTFEGRFGPFTATARESLLPFCDKLSEALVTYFVANVEVTVHVTPTDAGLQRTTTVGAATDAPVSTVTLSGSVS